jgi:anaerobic dimethyl sulfoxide reductase subunit C (anchor subunit)
MAVSLLHLGRPSRAWRALSHLGTSWLSREILLMALFTAVWAALFATEAAGGPAGLRVGLALVTAVAGVGLVYSMAHVYRLRTVPAWDTVRTTAGFFTTAAVLGGLTVVWVGEIFAYFAPGGEGRALGVGVAGSALGVVVLAAVRLRTWFYAGHARVGV